MTEETFTHCVLVPCSDTERWAVPQNCLAEILTINSKSAAPPDEVSWRGLTVPVVDFGAGSEIPWSDERVGTGLVAVFLGLKGEGCEYWGVAVRGSGLEVAALPSSEVSDRPEAVVEHAIAAFEYKAAVYQVPDLDRLQKKLAASLQAA
ncbi:MAG: hypothetical protein U5K56_14730 [Halioglobus sp.]|nr:hypothetical protein [Halioglobus sp.]